jgi:hypothetical protein
MERTGGIGIRTAESAFRCMGRWPEPAVERRSAAVVILKLARVRMRTILACLLAGVFAAIEAEAATLDGSSLSLG